MLQGQCKPRAIELARIAEVQPVLAVFDGKDSEKRRIITIFACFFVPLHLKIGLMTLRELINSVDSEQYSDNELYQKLRDINPEYGSSRHIQVKVVDGNIAITNLHVGSLGDILTYPIDVDPDLNISKIQLMDAILKELSSDGFTESEASDFWSDFDNLQKAKIVR